jgi:hypothetical protein
MLKTSRVFALGAPLFLILFFIFTNHAQASANDKSYIADKFDATAQIATDNTMQVTETEVFHFSGGSFSFVSREIPTDNTDGITILSAGMDGQTMSQGSDTGQFEVDASSNPITITWHFLAQPETTHTFTLKYQIQGIIQKQSQEDLVDWKPLPDKHAYLITSSTITLNYPPTATLLRTPEIDQGEATISQATGGVTYHATNIPVDQGIELGLRFQPGLVSNAPQWQQASERNSKLLPFTLFGGLLIAVLGSYLPIRRYRRYRRPNPDPTQLATMGITAPPENLPPAIAGVLAETNDGNPSWNQALATIFNLMDRGIIAIAPPSSGGWLLGSTDFNLALLNLPSDLLPHEAVLVNLLFQQSRDITPLVSITMAGKKYRSNTNKFSKAIHEELMSMEVFDIQRLDIYQRLGRIAGWMLWLGIIISILTPFVAPWTVVFIPVSFVIVSIAIYIARSSFPLYNERAYQTTLSWKAFAEFLDLVCTKQAVLGVEFLTTYLAYATAFDLLDRWAHRLQHYGMVALPPWFRELVTAGYIRNQHDAMSEFQRMRLYASRAGENQTSSDSGGSGSSMSGSSGAAGGGSSSAG